jgi:hypothetical protein
VPPGSRLAVGSSRTRIPGTAASTPASASRCCWPPDSRLPRLRPRPSSPTARSASGTRASILPRSQPRFSSPNATSSSTRSMTICESGSWNTIPTRSARAAGSHVRVSVPSTSRLPSKAPAISRGTSPAIARPSVLLPDPEGPTTRSTCPGSRSNEMSDSAGRAAPV